jgi:hypothetical protein
MASCDLLLGSQLSVSTEAFTLTQRRPGQRAQPENLVQRISDGLDRAIPLTRQNLDRERRV